MSVGMDREYVLPPMGELRIATAVSTDSTAALTLKPAAAATGDTSAPDAPRADICGAELSPGSTVQLPAGRSIAVFSPTGCTLLLSAAPMVHHATYCTACSATFARSIADIHTHLESRRVSARRGGLDALGPRVLVVSDRPQVGASTYICTLANYCVRLGYHPLLMDFASEAPRFGFPGAAALFALQQTIGAEDDTLFLPALHAHVGAGKHEDPSLFLHIVRQLTRYGTERMARSDRCRVGGLFVDYGAISPALVEDAEEWECNALRENERRRTNPLDTLIDTVLEAGIDHVLVVKSAWLRFKIAQRMHMRFTPHTSKPVAPLISTPSTVLCPDGLRVGLFLIDAADGRDTADSAHARRQRWLQYFFGTRTSPVRPVLLTMDVELVRIVQIGRGEAESMSTFMPMNDEDHMEDPTAALHGAASLSYVLPQDIDLKDRIVAISAATEQEELADGTLQRVPFATFESRLRTGLLMGFALVESVSAVKMTLLTNGASIRKDCGLCLVVTEDRLATKST